ncbi:tryptophan--tRNA ligase [Halobacillus salinarum]|uniref:Tryptophan--tRNA ligase n=1 Tax=Halobacillus salinarum TaxID=2932257 RepID=A0ABY4EJX6_9BACI|nr:tryptophan--tRNA ligase [Halobacillus salinarum]UOQ44383.1 tryptophan--tRNA ligase [Halobacillus salinarum]
MKRIITGIKPTGTPHVGNYLGAIKPALKLAAEEEHQSMYFIADLHALNSIHNRSKLKSLTYEVAAAWLALGLDPERSLFYRQSDIKELPELHWILSSVTGKGLMNRAHAYKAQVEQNNREGRDRDDGVNMGLFNYPILMAADILLFNGSEVPVGKDNRQHLEMAKDIGESFNRLYGSTFDLPTPVFAEGSEIIPGLDGRKMSKSYGNTIPLFTEEKSLHKLVKRIVTDSLPPEAPKDREGSPLFTLFREFATPIETEQMAHAFQKGIGYGEIKEELFLVMNRVIAGPRVKYRHLLENTDEIDKCLKDGGSKVRKEAAEHMDRIRERVGL